MTLSISVTILICPTTLAPSSLFAVSSYPEPQQTRWEKVTETLPINSGLFSPPIRNPGLKNNNNKYLDLWNVSVRLGLCANVFCSEKRRDLVKVLQ